MLSAAPGGHLRNVKKSRLRVTVRMSTDAKATVALVGAGAAILDNPTRAHWIGQGRSTKRLKSGVEGPFRPGRKQAHAIKIGNNWVMGPVLHPGTKGKHTFNRGTEAATPAAFKALTEGVRLPVAGVFR